MNIANREEYQKYVAELANAAVSKTLGRWHYVQDVPDLMVIEEHEISAHEVVRDDPWFRRPRSWPDIYRYTYHQPIAKALNERGFLKPEFMPTLAYCAFLQDVIRAIEYKLKGLREEGGDLRNLLRTAPSAVK